MNNAFLSPLKPKLKSSKLNIAYADCESRSLTDSRFRCGSVSFLDKNSEIKAITFFDKFKFFEFFAKFDVVYFYNIKYDSQFLRNACLKLKGWEETPVDSGSNLLGLRYRHNDKRQFIVKDILPFCQSTLEQACKEYSVQTKKFDVDFNNCTNEEIQHHCENDVLMLYELIEAIRSEWVKTWKVDPCSKRIYSLPAAAIRAYRVSLKKKIPNPFILVKYGRGRKPVYHFRAEIEQFCREAYKGGYCNAESTELHSNIIAFDVTSEYPFAIQAIRFPTGRALWTNSQSKFLKHCMRIPGIARVTLKLDIPLLCGTREGKLVRLSGIFTETLTSYEIFAALKYGGEILEFIRGVIFTEYDKTNSFAYFERKAFKIKTYSKGGKKVSAKLVCNSPYGKVAQNPIQKSRVYYYFRNEKEKNALLLGLSKSVEQINAGNDCGVFISEEDSMSLKPFMNVVWGALITGFSRLYLVEAAIKTNSTYEDTDSVKVEQCNVHLLDNQIPQKPYYKNPKGKHQLLGFWVSEGHFEYFRGLAPKTYAGFSSELAREENISPYLVRAKGIPRFLHIELFYNIVMGEDVISTRKFTRIMGCAEGIRAKTFLSKDGLFGGIRETQKTISPEAKSIYADFT